jgi:hypothetical protein
MWDLELDVKAVRWGITRAFLKDKKKKAMD